MNPPSCERLSPPWLNFKPPYRVPCKGYFFSAPHLLLKLLFLGKPSQLQRSLRCIPHGPSMWPLVLQILPLTVVEQAGELHPLFHSMSLTCLFACREQEADVRSVTSLFRMVSSTARILSWTRSSSVKCSSCSEGGIWIGVRMVSRARKGA